MKLSNMILILVVIQATIILYDQVYDAGDYELESYSTNSSVLWSYIINPVGGSSSTLITTLIGLTITGGLIGIGTYLYTKSDTVLFLPIFILLLGLLTIPIVSLYQVFTRDVHFFGCAAMPCANALWAWAITGGLLALLYVIAVLEWWSGRSMSTG